VNDVLVAAKNVEVLLHHIHTLICAMAHSKDTPEHVQETGVGAGGGGGGGTTTAGSVSRSHNWRRRSAMASWILWNSRAKWLMCYILVEPLMGHRLDHAHEIPGKINTIGEG
jgi:hypothetical protein